MYQKIKQIAATSAHYAIKAPSLTLFYLKQDTILTAPARFYDPAPKRSLL